jgi:hypothetical protein
VAADPVSTASFLKSLPSACVYTYFPDSSKQRLGKNGATATRTHTWQREHTRSNTRIVGRVSSAMRSVSYLGNYVISCSQNSLLHLFCSNTKQQFLLQHWGIKHNREALLLLWSIKGRMVEGDEAKLHPVEAYFPKVPLQLDYTRI